LLIESSGEEEARNVSQSSLKKKVTERGGTSWQSRKKKGVVRRLPTKKVLEHILTILDGSRQIADDGGKSATLSHSPKCKAEKLPHQKKRTRDVRGFGSHSLLRESQRGDGEGVGPPNSLSRCWLDGKRVHEERL